MISQLAIGRIEEMQCEGLSPTPADIIRLNALGLKLEGERNGRQNRSTYLLPRVAVLDDKVSFRQPTIGHELWLEKIDRFINRKSYETILAVRAFALSRPADDLPDGDDPKSFKKAIEGFAASLGDYTRDQIYAAVNYAMFGCEQTALEIPARPKAEGEADETPDPDESIALGILNEGRAVLWGISLADMRGMTPRQLQAVIRRAYTFHNIELGKDSQLEVDFYATFDEIHNRLIKERDEANGGA